MKFNTVKSKVLLFLSILTLLGTIFCIVSCDNFLSQNLGKTSININLDLSKLIKNSRNDDTQINGYVLKLFVYYAKNYQEGDKEIENLPLLTQTSNKVDINGTVKASLELSIASTVIFVGKLFTLNENNIESDKPLYAGKTDVYKVLPYNNNVHLVLSRDKAEIGFDIELQETHEHTFSREWSTSATHHWKVATCEHTEEVSKFGEHTFGEYVSNNDATTEADGTKTRVCSVCGYEDTVKDEGSKIHEHTFSREWSTSATHHWKVATCEHSSEVSEKAEHSYGEWITTKEATEETAGSKERVCTVCKYKETAEIAQLAHTHTFAIEWTYDGTYHWKVATCGHTEEVSGKAEHTFDGIACTECDYEIEGFALIPAGTFKMGSNDGYDANKPIHDVAITKDFYMGKYEVTQGEYEKYCEYVEKLPNSSYGEGDNYPVYYVSWYDALVYCNKRSIAEGLTPCYSIEDFTDPDDWESVPISSNSSWDAVECDWESNGYRLPTEAEWEYAARGGDKTITTLTYSGISSTSGVGSYAWYTANSDSKTHIVGQRRPNAFDLYDMSGNVSEWCWNWSTTEYDTTTEGESDPIGALNGSSRVHRGGGWSSNLTTCSVQYRDSKGPSLCSYTIGFRVVRSCPSTSD